MGKREKRDADDVKLEYNERKDSEWLGIKSTIPLVIGPSRVGAIVIDSPVAQAFAKKGNVKIVLNITTNESYGFAVEKGNTELANKINAGLTAVKAKTYWETLVEKYFAT